METTIKKWGNSLAVRLPQHVATDLNLNEGSEVSLHVEDNTLVIKPAHRKYRLEDLLKGHKQKHNHGEIVWGGPMGKEVW